MDWTIGWVYKSTRWGTIDEVLDPELAKFIHSLEEVKDMELAFDHKQMLIDEGLI